MQILYVEDDRLLAKSVELLLQKEGHFCHSTNLGERAIELAKRNKYDVIVLDVMLPDIDGFQVINRLRQMGVDTPCLVQTGMVDRHGPGNDLKQDYEDLLIKPFGKEELIERVERTVSRATRRRAVAPSPGVKDQEFASTEKRRHRRFKTIKAGQIVLGTETNACVVLDIAHGGAALRLPSHLLDCPDQFELRLQSGRVYNCEVCWRDKDKVGVKFIDD